MNRIVSIILLALSAAVTAEDGLVVQLTISEETLDGSERSSYTNAVLMSYPGISVSELSDEYEVKFQIESPEDGTFDLAGC